MKSYLKSLAIIGVGAVCLIVGAWLSGHSLFGTSPQALIVYCAHDSEYSEPILKEFERRTGIPVLIRFDSEATKTLGLVNLLVQEKSNPRCDVFWCNETLSLLHLKEQGILEPYRGSGHARIPELYKDPDGAWTGFAGRLRVHIYNHNLLPDLNAEQLETLWNGTSLTKLAIAKPLYGTTLVHYSILTEAWGLEKLKDWHHQNHQRGLTDVNGNGAVKNSVAQGHCLTGWTDSDDYFAAVDAEQPVSMLPIRFEGKTICIPNAVALIAGSKHPEAARKLVDYLLSEETEIKLSQSVARQIPLGEMTSNELTPEIQQLSDWAKEGYDLRGLEKPRAACLNWLIEEYTGIKK